MEEASQVWGNSVEENCVVGVNGTGVKGNSVEENCVVGVEETFKGVE